MQNMVGTLAKVAVGAMLARGVGKMLGGGSSQSSSQAPSGLGGLLGGLIGGKAASAFGGGGGGLAGGLGALLGGGKGLGGGQAGGLGNLLDSLGGNRSGGSLGLMGEPSSDQGSSLGGLLNAALRGESSDVEVSQQTEQDAQILLQAMIAAAKSDGVVDDDEQQRILGKMGDVSQAEEQFLRDEMASTFDLNAFIRTVPQGMEQQVYLMSLLAIDLDSQEEAQYLDRLRRGLNLSEQQCNGIHQQLGAPALYH